MRGEKRSETDRGRGGLLEHNWTSALALAQWVIRSRDWGSSSGDEPVGPVAVSAETTGGLEERGR
ncbi:hypothetical protein AMECASPLE_006279, partial [Ameca splendens]